MNLGSIFALILSHPQEIESTVAGLINMYKATTAAIHTVVPAVPATGSTPAVPAVTKKPSEAIKSLQQLLNQFVKPQPALVEDGWLGAKTEDAITKAIAMAKPYLGMLGG